MTDKFDPNELFKSNLPDSYASDRKYNPIKTDAQKKVLREKSIAWLMNLPEEERIARLKAISQRNKARAFDPEWKKKWKELFSDPVWCEWRSQQISKGLADPKCRENMSKNSKEFLKTKKGKHTHKKMIKLAQTKEAKQKRRNTSIEKGLHHDPALLKEIYHQCWTADRSQKLYDKLAKKYGMKPSIVKQVACGSFMDAKIYQKDLENWRKNYGILYKIIDPQGKIRVFDNINDARKWAGQEVWGNFKGNQPKKSGKFKGWTFIKSSIGEKNI